MVRLKMRNLLTNAVFDKTFRASDKFKEPDLQIGPASYLYSDGDGSHFLDQETFETLTLTEDMVGDARDFLIDGSLIELHKYNGNPIGLELPNQVELTVPYADPGGRAGDAAGSVTKTVKLETGLEIRVPLFINIPNAAALRNRVLCLPVTAFGPSSSCCWPKALPSTRLNDFCKPVRLPSFAGNSGSSSPGSMGSTPIIPGRRPRF